MDDIEDFRIELEAILENKVTMSDEQKDLLGQIISFIQKLPKDKQAEVKDPVKKTFEAIITIHNTLVQKMVFNELLTILANACQVNNPNSKAAVSLGDELENVLKLLQQQAASKENKVSNTNVNEIIQSLQNDIKALISAKVPYYEEMERIFSHMESIINGEEPELAIKAAQNFKGLIYGVINNLYISPKKVNYYIDKILDLPREAFRAINFPLRADRPIEDLSEEELDHYIQEYLDLFNNHDVSQLDDIIRDKVQEELDRKEQEELDRKEQERLALMEEASSKLFNHDLMDELLSEYLISEPAEVLKSKVNVESSLDLNMGNTLESIENSKKKEDLKGSYKSNDIKQEPSSDDDNESSLEDSESEDFQPSKSSSESISESSSDKGKEDLIGSYKSNDIKQDPSSDDDNESSLEDSESEDFQLSESSSESISESFSDKGKEDLDNQAAKNNALYLMQDLNKKIDKVSKDLKYLQNIEKNQQNIAEILHANFVDNKNYSNLKRAQQELETYIAKLPQSLRIDIDKQYQQTAGRLTNLDTTINKTYTELMIKPYSIARQFHSYARVEQISDQQEQSDEIHRIDQVNDQLIATTKNYIQELNVAIEKSREPGEPKLPSFLNEAFTDDLQNGIEHDEDKLFPTIRNLSLLLGNKLKHKITPTAASMGELLSLLDQEINSHHLPASIDNLTDAELLLAWIKAPQTADLFNLYNEIVQFRKTITNESSKLVTDIDKKIELRKKTIQGIHKAVMKNGANLHQKLLQNIKRAETELIKLHYNADNDPDYNIKAENIIRELHETNNLLLSEQDTILNHLEAQKTSSNFDYITDTISKLRKQYRAEEILNNDNIDRLYNQIRNSPESLSELMTLIEDTQVLIANDNINTGFLIAKDNKNGQKNYETIKQNYAEILKRYNTYKNASPSGDVNLPSLTVDVLKIRFSLRLNDIFSYILSNEKSSAELQAYIDDTFALIEQMKLHLSIDDNSNDNFISAVGSLEEKLDSIISKFNQLNTDIQHIDRAEASFNLAEETKTQLNEIIEIGNSYLIPTHYIHLLSNQISLLQDQAYKNQIQSFIAKVDNEINSLSQDLKTLQGIPNENLKQIYATDLLTGHFLGENNRFKALNRAYQKLQAFEAALPANLNPRIRRDIDNQYQKLNKRFDKLNEDIQKTYQVILPKISYSISNKFESYQAAKQLDNPEQRKRAIDQIHEKNAGLINKAENDIEKLEAAIIESGLEGRSKLPPFLNSQLISKLKTSINDDKRQLEIIKHFSSIVPDKITNTPSTMSVLLQRLNDQIRLCQHLSTSLPAQPLDKLLLEMQKLFSLYEGIVEFKQNLGNSNSILISDIDRKLNAHKKQIQDIYYVIVNHAPPLRNRLSQNIQEAETALSELIMDDDYERNAMYILNLLEEKNTLLLDYQQHTFKTFEELNIPSAFTNFNEELRKQQLDDIDFHMENYTRLSQQIDDKRVQFELSTLQNNREALINAVKIINNLFDKQLNLVDRYIQKVNKRTANLTVLSPNQSEILRELSVYQEDLEFLYSQRQIFLHKLHNFVNDLDDDAFDNLFNTELFNKYNMVMDKITNNINRPDRGVIDKSKTVKYDYNPDKKILVTTITQKDLAREEQTINTSVEHEQLCFSNSSNRVVLVEKPHSANFLVVPAEDQPSQAEIVAFEAWLLKLQQYEFYGGKPIVLSCNQPEIIAFIQIAAKVIGFDLNDLQINRTEYNAKSKSYVSVENIVSASSISVNNEVARAMEGRIRGLLKAHHLQTKDQTQATEKETQLYKYNNFGLLKSAIAQSTEESKETIKQESDKVLGLKVQLKRGP